MRPEVALASAIRGSEETHPVTLLSSLGLTSKDAPKLRLYHRLVLGRFEGAIVAVLPRTAARLGSTRLRLEISQFLEHHALESPLLIDLPRAFVAWAVPRWQRDHEVPPYLADLARHELLLVDLAAAPDDEHVPLEMDLAQEAHLVFRRAVAIVRYEHQVHVLSEDPTDTAEPRIGAVALLGYRDSDHQVRLLELSPLAARIFEKLLEEGSTLRSAVVEGCAELSTPVDDGVLSGLVSILTDLAERGVLRGATPASRTAAATS